MKKFLLLLACCFSFSTAVLADDDKPIQFSQLPEKAQLFIQNHFSRADVSRVTADDDSYEVKLKGGVQIEFNRKGKWTEIESKRKGVPAKIVPERVMRQVAKRFGNQVKVVEISRDNEEMEVKLSNGKELEFNRKNRTVEVDD